MRSAILGGFGLMLSATMCLAHGYGGHGAHGCHGGYGRGYASRGTASREARDERAVERAQEAVNRAEARYSKAIGRFNDQRELAAAENVGAAEAAAEKAGTFSP